MLFAVQKKYQYLLEQDSYQSDVLTNIQKRQDLIECLRELNYNREYGEAHDIYLKLLQLIEHNPNLKGSNWEEVESYCLVSSFPVLSPEQAAHFLQNKLVWSLRQGFDMLELIIDFIVFQLDFALGGVIRRSFIESIKRNEEVIGEPADFSRFKIVPSVKFWLGRFDSKFPPELKRSRVEELDFINQDERVKILDKQSKDILEKILEIYDVLLFGRRDLSEGESAKIPAAGISIDFGLPTKEQTRQSDIKDDLKNKLLSNYRLDTIRWEEVRGIASKIGKLEKQKEFLLKFHQFINSRDKEGILASLLVLAKQGKLDEIFEIDKKIRDIFAQHLQKKFSEKLAQHFLQNLREPVYISYFLQHLLKDILKLDENESAVIAIKLANELKRAGDKEYLAIAYGDLSDGTFKWKTIIEEDAKLTLADK